MAIGPTAFPYEEYRSAHLRRRPARTTAEEIPRLAQPHRPRRGRHHRQRHFRAYRHGRRRRNRSIPFHPESPSARCADAWQARAGRFGPPWSRTGDRGFLFRRGGDLRLGGLVLRGAGLDDSHRRQRVYLHLRDAGRTRRLDHRLGSDSRIRRLEHGRRGGLLGLHQQPARFVRHSPARRAEFARLFTRYRLGAAFQHHGLSHRDVSHGAAGVRHPRIGRRKQRHGRHQDPRHRGVLRRGQQIHSALQLAPVLPQSHAGSAHRRSHRFLHLHRI